MSKYNIEDIVNYCRHRSDFIPNKFNREGKIKYIIKNTWPEPAYIIEDSSGLNVIVDECFIISKIEESQHVDEKQPFKVPSFVWFKTEHDGERFFGMVSEVFDNSFKFEYHILSLDIRRMHIDYFNVPHEFLKPYEEDKISEIEEKHNGV